MRIATGCIGHETNSFSPVATTLESFDQARRFRSVPDHWDNLIRQEIARLPSDAKVKADVFV